MVWLRCDGRVVAPLEVANTRRARRRGLLGRDSLDGALLLPATRWVHTFGMRFPLDVAHLAGDGRVTRVSTMAPRRLGRPVLSARSVLEAQAGAFDRWDLRAGLVVEPADAGHEGGRAG